MSAKTEKLLAQYRTYEGLVRDAGQDPLEVENGMPELESNRMRMVRQFRNFLSHNQAPGFLEPTDKMLAFLDKQVTGWAMKGDVVKKHVKGPMASVCYEKETCAAGLEKLAKLKMTRLVVIDKAGAFGLCDMFALAALVAASKNAKLSTAPRLREKPVFVRPDILVTDLDPDRVHVCTDDGTPGGKLLGVVKL